MRVIAGVELSTLYQHEYEVHLLGLFIDPHHAELAATLARAAEERVRRAERRIQIEVLYEVQVTLPLYSVDLHFRPRAGG